MPLPKGETPRFFLNFLSGQVIFWGGHLVGTCFGRLFFLVLVVSLVVVCGVWCLGRSVMFSLEI